MTLREIYQALIDGKKLRYATWEPGEYIHLVGTYLLGRKGEIIQESFKTYYNWSIYEEPEDLKAKIVRTEVIAADFLRYQPGFAIAHISQLIDLKIKQAKL